MAQALITVSGNVGKEPALRETANGKSYWTFSIANTPRTKKGDEWVDGETIWFSVSFFGAVQGLVVGTPVLVTGTFVQKSYTKDDGTTGTANYVNADTIGIIPKRENTTSATWDNTATPIVTKVANATDLIADFDSPF